MSSTQIATARVVIALSYAAWLSGCSAKAHDDPLADVPDSPNAAVIRELIGKLAISDEKASPDPIYTPSKDTPKTDERVIAYDAAKRLREFGMEAFPFLLACLEDDRQSVAFRRVLPSTVGDACYCLVARQLYALPKDYQGSFFRKGADGRRHERPVFSNDLITPDNIRAWLAEREGRTLRELQLEALGWVLAEEERIGAATPEDEERFLAPLRTRYAEIKKHVDTADADQGSKN